MNNQPPRNPRSRKRWKAAVLVILLVAIFFLVPLVPMGHASPCAAFCEGPNGVPCPCPVEPTFPLFGSPCYALTRHGVATLIENGVPTFEFM
jgi:hypothetical protein